MKNLFFALPILLGFSAAAFADGSVTAAGSAGALQNGPIVCSCHEDAVKEKWDLVTVYQDKTTGTLTKSTFATFGKYHKSYCEAEIRNLMLMKICPSPVKESQPEADTRRVGNACVIIKRKVEGDVDNMIAVVFGPGSDTVYDIYVDDQREHSFDSGSAAKAMLKSLIQQGVCKK